MHRALPIVAFALSLAASPGECGEAVVADPDAQVEYSGTLSILTKFGMQQLAPYFVGVAKEYEKRHPGVKIELIQESDESIKGKTRTLVAANALPDIYFSWPGSWGRNFVRSHRAVDLSRLLGPETAWGKTLAPAAVRAFEYNGRFYGIPLYLDAKFMGYNKSIFKKAGVAVPGSLEQLVASCADLRKAGIPPIALGNKEGWPALHFVGQLVVYNVPRATLERDFDPAKARFDDPGYVLSLQQFKQLADHCTDGVAVNGSSYAAALQKFSNADAAMYYQEIIEFDQSAVAGTRLRPADFGFFRLPPPAGAQGDVNAIEGAPEGYMLNASSKKIPLAIDFMKFLTAPDHARRLSAPPYGQPSATIGGASASDMTPAVVAGLQEIAAASYLMPWLDTANSPRVAAAWLSSLQALLGGSMDAHAVMGAVKKASAADAKHP
ncbi:ABC transporter substrate-binding protein [Verminephrobacter aporrectodeae]|uniref:ABC transporter substrate-binding protein n=2 Tax=Verminephrobacter aporrectodeae TaxID=1110389 RepID=UPI0022377067|nr:extracellular solute-binding protein [Verminephrobacter aporrectodeae]MCW5219795.1 extracellular solute-binding protein [Verminephrobacter aporrectodeae subsp. tuberculatae]MCW5256208.1 extracellular solute-binding protein [Verminephrobacter aporrectodeae subsp. tuberculatae]MCW5287507.1 extracellular solute-binding protein [Verminephrobacter aporrectodeae subsp. tuberculatae]MCW8163945.1 extracellular solute-binding protein [Verminephrobacter aporrectodeae subsp. tuberculatae]MCW8170252.1 